MREKPSRAQLLHEATELEKAGALWEICHVMAFTGYACSSIRILGCPRVTREGDGRSGRGRVLFEPAVVRAWYASRLRRIA